MNPYLAAALALLAVACLAAWLFIGRPRARRRALRRSVAEARLAELADRHGVRPDIGDGLRFRGVDR